MMLKEDFETVREALGPLEEFAWNALARIEAENKRLRALLSYIEEIEPVVVETARYALEEDTP